MSMWFCMKFQNLENYTMQSRGGILLAFAGVASCVQRFLLHALLHFATKVEKSLVSTLTLTLTLT
jgi:hypothetical protein